MGRQKRLKKERVSPENEARGELKNSPEMKAEEIMVLLFGLLISSLFFVFDLKTYDQYEFPRILIMRVGAMVLIAISIFIFAKRGNVPKMPRLALISFLAFYFALCVVTLTSVSPRTSLYGTYESLEGLFANLSYGVVFLVSAFFIHTFRRAKIFFSVLALGMLLLVASALFYRAGYDFPGLLGYVTSRNDPNRIGATMGNPNFLGAVLYMGIPLIFGLMLTIKNKKLVYSMGTLIALMVLSISFTGARTAYAMVLLMPFLWVFLDWMLNWRRKEQSLIFKIKPAYIGVGAFIIVVSAYVSRVQLDRFLTSITSPLSALGEHRFILWRPAMRVFLDYPLFGSGVDTFKIASAHYLEPVVFKQLGPDVVTLRAHNEILNSLATTGLLGTLTWLFFFAVIVYYGYKAALKLQDREGGYLARGALISFVAIFIGSLVNFGIVATYTLSFALGGMLVGLAGAQNEGEKFAFALSPTLKKVMFSLFAFSTVFSLVVVADTIETRKADMTYFECYIKASKSKYEDALPYCEEAVRILPENPKYLFYLAQIEELVAYKKPQEMRRKLAEKALEHFQTAFEIEPINPSLMSGIGRCYFLLDKTDEALAWVKRAKDEAPGIYRHHAALIKLLTKLNHIDEALPELFSFEKTWENYEGYTLSMILELAPKCEVEKRFEDAIKLYRLAIKYAPDKDSVWSRLAFNLEAVGQNEEALKTVQKALELNPQDSNSTQLKKILEEKLKAKTP